MHPAHISGSRSGCSRARNTGVKEAKGQIIIFLDSDMIVRREFVAAHLAAHSPSGVGGQRLR